MSDMIGRYTNISSHANLIRLLSKLCIIPKTPYTDTKITHYIVYPKEFLAHPTNPVEGCADANPKT
uniref:hypothetical protein n=1 Tax=Prevotella sp. TaxID=59823 RepID=UPI00307FA812